MKTMVLVGLVLTLMTAIACAQANEAPQPAAVPKAASLTPQQEEALYYRSVFGSAPDPTFRSARLLIEQLLPITLEAARDRMSTRLALAIENIERQCPLTDAQKKKLRAAGELDIRHFFDRVEHLKKEFMNGIEERTNRKEFVNRAEELARIRANVSARTQLGLDFETGLFGPDSYFAKVLSSTVDAKQAARLQKVREDRNQARRQTRAILMTQLWSDALGLDDAQRRTLSELILQEIPLPERAKPTDYTFAMYRLAQLSPNRIRPIFNEAQWNAFNRRLDEYNVDEIKKLLMERGYDLGEAKQPERKPEPAK